MTDAAMWAVIVGFISPLVLNFIISATWPAWVKALIAFGFSAIVGTVTAIIAGAYEGLGIPSTILLTAVVAITAYQSFWKQVAPNLQRGSEAKAELDAESKRRDVAAIAAPVAANVATQTVEAMPHDLTKPDADTVG
jgi:hypothetical protein